MEKGFIRTLRVKMVVVVVAGILLSTVSFVCCQFLLGKYVDNVYMNEENMQRRQANQVQSFTSYVTSHGVKASDTKALRTWQEATPDAYLIIYNDNEMVFDSDWMIQKRGAHKYVISNSDTGELVILIQDSYGNIRRINQRTITQSYKNNTRNYTGRTGMLSNSSDTRVDDFYIDKVEEFNYTFYPVLFKDGVFDVCIVDYSDEKVREIGRVSLFVLFSLMFVFIILFYFGREINRLRRLTREVMDIKEVDINGPITKSGEDEIRMLADNIDNMRNTIISQLSREKEAWQANSDLVTAMAHDIRTPLTVMAGYLDLMKNKDYSSQEELDEYIRISSEKAEQLRMMSDKMFRYFYVYSKGDEELNMEVLPAAPLFEQMIGEYIVLLEEKGFRFNVSASDKEASVRVDVQGMKRITDNIFTNIRKYSDKSKPIDIRLIIDGRKIRLHFKNYISPDSNKAESTHIGTLTCKKMAQEMGASFTCGKKGKQYEAVLVLRNVDGLSEKELEERGMKSIIGNEKD